MKTTTIQIGNSDNKLTQEQWALFYNHVDNAVRTRANRVYFSGASHPASPWQNAAWIFEVDEFASIRLYDYMKLLCEDFNQDSIAWTEGETILITSAKQTKEETE